MIFQYRSETGSLRFPMDVDGHRPFNAIVQDAHNVAATRGFGPEAFITCVIDQDQRHGRLASIGEIIQPLIGRARS